ncbi:MAG: hypothetical protein FWD66_01015 [Paludibacter sp.]|nr:hypothetical protein [Paludibacter sp.]
MDKIICCGECNKFLYEDTDGNGQCKTLLERDLPYIVNCADKCLFSMTIPENCEDYGKSNCGISAGEDMFDSAYCWDCC